jgi:hypothetical protein
MKSICIVDFCGRDSTLGRNVDFSADYYPKEKVVKFINCWGGVPDMPCNSEPSEQAVYNWVKNNPNWYEKQRVAELSRKQAFNKRFEDIQKHFDKKGYNVIHCIISLANGEQINACHGCGIYDWKTMLQSAKHLLNKNPGSKISYFRHYTGIKDVENFVAELKEKEGERNKSLKKD